MSYSRKKALNPLPLPKTVEEKAPAKVNLTLHVTGQRADGYHVLDSLVVFSDCGERLRAEARVGPPSLSVTGPLSRGVPADERNLILRAADLFDPVPGVAFELHKTLPHAAGIGGGSADAAAALRAVHALTGMPQPPATRIAALGADLPVCLSPEPQRMGGIGDVLQTVTDLPDCALLLVNPGVFVPTGAVFGAMERRDNPPMQKQFPHWEDAAALARWLADQRNDMEPAALKLAPVIGKTLALIRSAPKCLLARMSGSGATCFGLFSSLKDAQAAQSTLAIPQDWWRAAAQVSRATT